MNSFTAARENESGFTLVELLVVIAIIAILTAIAVPSFLNQRAKANDAAVRSDMKSVVTTIETGLLEEPSGVVQVTTDTSTGLAQVGILNAPTSAYGTSIQLSKGVTVTSVENSTNNGYGLVGNHTSGTGEIYYNSLDGGFVTVEPEL